MARYYPAAIMALTGILAGCSGSQFNKGTNSSSRTDPVSPKETAGESMGTAAEPVASEYDLPSTPMDAPAPPVPLVKDEDKAALSECLKQWPNHPFSAAEIARPQVFDITEAVNNNGLIYSNDKVTEKPALYLINFNINVGNNGELEFLNPKGWFCFNVKAKVINNFIINTACGTKVAILSKLAQNDKNFTVQPVTPCP